MDSILKAQEACEQAYEEHAAIKSKRDGTLTTTTFIVVASLVATMVGAVACGLLGVEKSAARALLATFLGLAVVGIFVFFAVLIAFEKSRKAAAEHANSLREARLTSQKKFVEAHGITLPVGAFENLSFPVLAPEGASIFGTADVLFAEAQKLVTVLLKFTPADGYTLSTTDGQLLRPLTPIASS